MIGSEASLGFNHVPRGLRPHVASDKCRRKFEGIWKPPRNSVIAMSFHLVHPLTIEELAANFAALFAQTPGMVPWPCLGRSTLEFMRI